jgi:pilus assembly protein CpaC
MRSKPIGVAFAVVLCALFWCVVLGRAAAQPAIHEATHLTLAIGEQRVLPTQGVRSFSEGVKGVVDVRLTSDSTKFIIIGLKPGNTTLLFLMTDGSEKHYVINVFDPNAQITPDAPVVNPNTVTAEANIRLDLYFVQFDRNYSHNLGVNVSPTVLTGNFDATFNLKSAALSPTTAIVRSQLMPQLDLAQAQGWAKVQRHVAVVTTNGTEATFDSGGFFNVLVATSQSTGIQSIKYGTNLGVVPRYDQTTQRLQLVVKAEISDLTATGAEIPGRSASTLTNVVNLELGESLAVAGLTAQSEERQRGGIAGLTQIPILGVLFSNRAAKSRETENVVFVVPSVVEPLKVSRGREFIESALRTFEEFDGDMEEVSVFPKPAIERTAAAANKDARN